MLAPAHPARSARNAPRGVTTSKGPRLYAGRHAAEAGLPDTPTRRQTIAAKPTDTLRRRRRAGKRRGQAIAHRRGRDAGAIRLAGIRAGGRAWQSGVSAQEYSRRACRVWRLARRLAFGASDLNGPAKQGNGRTPAWVAPNPEQENRRWKRVGVFSSFKRALNALDAKGNAGERLPGPPLPCISLYCDQTALAYAVAPVVPGLASSASGVQRVWLLACLAFGVSGVWFLACLAFGF
jgi:hypothetical protein